MNAPRVALWLVGLSLCTSCVQFTLERHHRLTPVAPSSLEQLAPGEANLEACLTELGAPLRVWEQPDGAALAWGWFESLEWGLDVSAPIDDQSASFTYDEVDSRMRGAVLFFDTEWNLESIRSGFLADLEAEVRKTRPGDFEVSGDGWEG